MDITDNGTVDVSGEAKLTNTISSAAARSDKERQNQQQQLKQPQWKTIGVKVRHAELPLLNRQLDLLSYVTLGELVKDLISGKISRLTDDQEIEIMKTNLQANGQITAIEGKPFDFYNQINIPDFQQYLNSKYHERTARCYLSYFERYARIFFGLNPEIELFKMNPHKRSWILQAIKRFGDYYYKKYNNRQVIELVKQIIERYDLNRNLDMKDRIYLVSPNFIEESIKKIFEIPGEIGFTIKIGLLSGLREGELIYVKGQEVCSSGYGCTCDNLHVVNCKNDLSIIAISWTRGNKKALATILPTSYWNKLRSLARFDYNDIAAAHRILKRDVGIAYMALRKIHYNVMRFKDTLAVDEAEVLAGRFRSVSSRHYVLHDPEKLTDKYLAAWRNFDVSLNKLRAMNGSC